MPWSPRSSTSTATSCASTPATTRSSSASARSPLALQQSAYVKQQKQIAHLRSYIDRFRAKATKAKQAQSRIKALERMELIAAAHVDSPFSFEFPATTIHARQLLKLDHVTLGYGGKPMLADVDWAILAGARIGLLGPNGAGKSTLLRAIAGDLVPSAGSATARARPLDRLFRAAPGRAAASRRERAVAPAPARARHARTGAARFSRRLRFSRRSRRTRRCANFRAAKKRG